VTTFPPSYVPHYHPTLLPTLLFSTSCATFLTNSHPYILCNHLILSLTISIHQSENASLHLPKSFLPFQHQIYHTICLPLFPILCHYQYPFSYSFPIAFSLLCLISVFVFFYYCKLISPILFLVIFLLILVWLSIMRHFWLCPEYTAFSHLLIQLCSRPINFTLPSSERLHQLQVAHRHNSKYLSIPLILCRYYPCHSNLLYSFRQSLFKCSISLLFNHRYILMVSSQSLICPIVPHKLF
jgi:hypothetical protein